jgi:uncharacterized protein (UPF0261 family)
MAYVETMRRELKPEIEQIEANVHINDPEFVQATVETVLRLLGGKRGAES